MAVRFTIDAMSDNGFRTAAFFNRLTFFHNQNLFPAAAAYHLQCCKNTCGTGTDNQYVRFHIFHPFRKNAASVGSRTCVHSGLNLRSGIYSQSHLHIKYTSNPIFCQAKQQKIIWQKMSFKSRYTLTGLEIIDGIICSTISLVTTSVPSSVTDAVPAAAAK